MTAAALERTADEQAKQPVRVLFLADHLGHSSGRVHGGTTYFVTVLPAVARAGVDLTACFMAPRHPAAEQLEAQGVRPIFLGRAKWDPRALFDVWRLVGRYRPQVLHLASLKSHLFGRLVAGLRNCRTIVHVHDTVPLGRVMGPLQRRVARWTDLVLGVSDPVSDFSCGEYGVGRERVRTLHNGIDVGRFARPSPGVRERVRREFGLESHAKLVGVIGRLAPMKGQDCMIRAMPLLLERCPGAVLLLVGEGAKRADYEALVRERRLEAAVRFTGQRGDVADILAALDAVAMPSLFGEGLPYAAVEAIAAGKPVVAFPTSGIPEVVVDGHTGFLVPREDIEALADALARVLTDADLAARLGEQGRRHAEQFTLEGHVQKLIDIYSALAATVSGRAAAPAMKSPQ
jgi:glycosyltransferase involved in cell wall biosynthesis